MTNFQFSIPNRRLACLLSFILYPLSFPAAPSFDALTNRSGEIISGIRITAADPAAVYYVRTNGASGGRLKLQDLAPDQARAFDYDPDRAAAFEKNQASQAAGQRVQAAQLAARTAQARADKAALAKQQAEIDRHTRRIRGTVGVKFRGQQPGFALLLNDDHGLDISYLVQDYPNFEKLLTGSALDLVVYDTGREFQYYNLQGNKRSLPIVTLKIPKPSLPAAPLPAHGTAPAAR